VSDDIVGLYLCGAGTHPGAGIPGVLLSARITSDLVVQALVQPTGAASPVAVAALVS